jgi:Mg2+ and Co2+ transporter CorA
MCPKVHPIDPEVLHRQSGVEVVKVSPSFRPTLESVIDHIELHPPAGAPTTFHWAIADTANSSDQALDHVSVSLMGSQFSDFTVKRDQGKRKVNWHGDILNCHVSRFTIDPDDPLRVKRSAVEIIMAPHGLVTVDQSGDRQHLIDLRDDIVEGRAIPQASASIGALAARVIQEQLSNNERVLDTLEARVDELSKLTSAGPLSHTQAHTMLPSLEEALAYFLRKTEQTREVLTAVEHSARLHPHFFGALGPKESLRDTRETLERVLRHAELVREKVNRVEDRHDRQIQARSDKNIERFTFALGLTVSPMLVDIGCKMLLPHHHEWHGPLFLSSIAAGAALVLWAVVWDWKPGWPSGLWQRAKKLK